jgi:hypothetical protein
MIKPKVIAVDFDGTCVAHAYPEVGKDIGAQEVLHELVKAGHKLILYTMRSDEKLMEARTWFEENDIPLYGVQKNPTQHTWTNSPKCYANLYIDDAALGIPLSHDHTLSQRSFVDWESVKKLLMLYNYLSYE